jgi:hypothetical protein
MTVLPLTCHFYAKEEAKIQLKTHQSIQSTIPPRWPPVIEVTGGLE